MAQALFYAMALGYYNYVHWQRHKERAWILRGEAWALADDWPLGAR